MPAGLNSQQILNERDRFIDAQIQQRICELGSMLPLNRLDFRRARKPTIRAARRTWLRPTVLAHRQAI
jgi:hypothetical protein